MHFHNQSLLYREVLTKRTKQQRWISPFSLIVVHQIIHKCWNNTATKSPGTVSTYKTIQNMSAQIYLNCHILMTPLKREWKPTTAQSLLSNI